MLAGINKQFPDLNVDITLDSIVGNVDGVVATGKDFSQRDFMNDETPEEIMADIMSLVVSLRNREKKI